MPAAPPPSSTALPSTSPASPTKGPWRWIGVGLALSVLGALVWRSNFLIDDAYISFRYARNWAETGIPAYNPGTTPPVEGYSNALWVMLLRACAGLSLDLEIVSRVLSCLFAVGSLLLLHIHLGQLGLTPSARFLGTLSLAAFPPFAVWATGGLETASFGFFVFAAYRVLSRALSPATSGASARGGSFDGWLAGVLGLAIALSRVEGPLWALAVALGAWLCTRANASPGQLKRALVRYAAVVFTGYGLFLLWRHATFGEWVANTVHAKGSLSADGVARGLKTSATFLLLFPTALIALGAWFRVRRGSLGPVAAGASGMLVIFLAYNTLVGGDWMPFFRFLAPASPFIALLLALLLNSLGRAALPAGLILAGVSLLPLFGRALAPRALLEPIYFRTFQVGYQTEWQARQKGMRNLAMFKMIGKGLRQIAARDDSLTFGAIGAIGYESGLHIHDRNGLVDREVARRSGHAASKSAGHDKQVPRVWFLDRHPTFFHAVVFEGPVGLEGSSTYEQAVSFARGMIEQRVFSDPEEAPLRELSTITVHRLEAEPGVPAGSLLLVLRAKR